MMRRSFPGSSASSAKVRPAGGGDAVVKWDPTGQQYVQVEAPETQKANLLIACRFVVNRLY